MSHNPYERLTDEELLSKLAHWREKAGSAPKALDNPSDAWARHAAEWGRLHREAKRRDLVKP